MNAQTAKLVVAVTISPEKAAALLSIIESTIGKISVCYIIFCDTLQQEVSLLQLLSRVNFSLNFNLAYTAAPLREGMVYVCPYMSSITIKQGTITLSTQRAESAARICWNSSQLVSKVAEGGDDDLNELHDGFSSFRRLVLFLGSDQNRMAGVVQQLSASDATIYSLYSIDRVNLGHSYREIKRQKEVSYFASIYSLINAIKNIIARTTTGEEQDVEFAPELSTRKLAALIAPLEKTYGINFSHYKVSTFQRALQRRMRVNQDNRVDGYIERLNQSTTELDAFYKNIIIGVTQFFRNPFVFAYLEKHIIPGLINRSCDAPIRLWVAGSSNGSEAYSFAILFREVMQRMNKVKNIRIYATDIDRASILKASFGRFSETELRGLPSSLRMKYFSYQEPHYQVNADVGSTITFAPHDLISHPPLPRMDMVSCRNTLIYFDLNKQKIALENIHFSLKEQGVLLLGSSESLLDNHYGYNIESSKHRVFRKYNFSKHLSLQKSIVSRLLGSIPGAVGCECVK